MTENQNDNLNPVVYIDILTEIAVPNTYKDPTLIFEIWKCNNRKCVHGHCELGIKLQIRAAREKNCSQEWIT